MEEAHARLGFLSLPGSLLSANWQWPGSQWPCLLQPRRQANGLNPGLQICGPAYSMPWAYPESSAGLHLAVIRLRRLPAVRVTLVPRLGWVGERWWQLWARGWL